MAHKLSAVLAVTIRCGAADGGGNVGIDGNIGIDGDIGIDGTRRWRETLS